jgi:hypothetical protein
VGASDSATGMYPPPVTADIMSLSEEARERLADLVEHQPTKNADLQSAWDMESGSDVHQYLESELKDYYYRDENSLICATPEAEAIVAGEDPESGPTEVRVSDLQATVIEVLGGPASEPQSVVATLHALDDRGHDLDVDTVRSALHGLVDRGAVERIQTTVPTFRLAVAREDLELVVTD